MDPAVDSDQHCLCLFCRGIGHIMENCPEYILAQEQDSTAESGSESSFPSDSDSIPPSPPFGPFQITEGSIQALCERCNTLEVLSQFASHPPVVLKDLEMANLNVDKYQRRVDKKTRWIPSLGHLLFLRLLSTCPLCRLIFDVSYLTDRDMEEVGDETELVLVIGWTIHRLEQRLEWKGCGRGKGTYAKCVYTSVATQFLIAGGYEPPLPVGEAMEAIGLEDIEEDRSSGAPALGVRRVDPEVPDYCVIKGWLRRCDVLHHVTCRPLVSKVLKQIKLVDVETRQIVKYPSAGCDYTALSYVWGDVEKSSYKLGDSIPSTIPATLEDAMIVTRKLEKQYLWVDSLCIDQEDGVEKDTQIALMSVIYSGAWATIICLSGESACSGIPRVGTLQGVIPQLSLEMWGKNLLSVMPTLSQQISWSTWASRAWTYQEGLLSPRRLFFTNHQVYFECNSVKCCESLDDSSSHFHVQTDEERRTALDWQNKFSDAGPESIIGWGDLRDPFRPISRAREAQTDNDNFARYLRLVNEYSMKVMSHDADALNAFSGVLRHLEADYYKKGFLQGLPVEDLPRALLWYHRTPSRRRIDFAAWSWAGWEGEVNDYPVHGSEDLDEVVMPPLRVWKGYNGHLELVYNFNPTPHIMKELEEAKERENESQDEADEREVADYMEDIESSGSSSDSDASSLRYEVNESISDEDPFEGIDFHKDPVFRLAKVMLEETPATLPNAEGNELLVEGIVIMLGPTEFPDYASDSDADSEGDWELRDVPLEGWQPQEARFYGYYADKLAGPESRESGNEQEFLLLSRWKDEEVGQKIYNALLLIDRDGDVANRVGVASLKLDEAELLDRFKPQTRMFKLRC